MTDTSWSQSTRVLVTSSEFRIVLFFSIEALMPVFRQTALMSGCWHDMHHIVFAIRCAVFSNC